MAGRNYNPDPYPISQKIEDTLERYNMIKNPSGEPMMFKYPKQVVIRNTYPQHIGLMVGGNIKGRVLEMDESQPMSRPRGFISPHGKGAEPKYIRNGNSASYPMYNSVEQKVLDGGNFMSELRRIAQDPKVKEAADKLLANPKNVTLRKLAANPEVQEIARATQKLVGSGRGRGRPRKHPALEGEGIWEDMNAWGRQNEANAKALWNSKQFQGVINDPRVQDLALKGLNKLVDGGEKKGKGMSGGRRRKIAMDMEGEGIWEDMNAWGKQNERNFNKFGQDFQRAATGFFNDPRVQAIINNPQIQKLGKKAIKMAVGAIPGIGPMASEALGYVGFGLRKGKPYTKMLKMTGEGIWEDMNAWGKQNERNFNKFGQDFERSAKGFFNDPRVQAIINNPAIQKLGKKAIKMAVGAIPGIGPMASEALGYVGFGLRKGKPYTKMLKLTGSGVWEDMNAWGKKNDINFNKFGSDMDAFNARNRASLDKMLGRGRPRKMIMEGDGVWEDMNAWGRQNERNAKALWNSKQFQGVINDPRVQDLALKGLNKLIDGGEKKGSGSGMKRADIVKQIMMKHSMSLPAASKYVKEHGLYQKM
jgi:hypothetical protein